MQYESQVVGLKQNLESTKSVARPVQIFAALMLGMSMLYIAGFMQSSAVHSAAHDMRHTIGFPCH